jgi:hypothetical protein
MNVKICSDCKFYSAYALCNHPKIITKETDLITGLKNVYSGSCIRLRKSSDILNFFLNRCGSKGKWFEPKINNTP